MGMIMMSCNYIHLHRFGCWFLFTFVFILCRYPIALKGAGCSYAVPCCYLYCTVARSKITYSTDAPRAFYAGTSHVSSRGGSPMGLRYFLAPCPLLSTCCWRRLIFLIYRFGTGLLKFRACLSSHLIIIRQLRLL